MAPVLDQSQYPLKVLYAFNCSFGSFWWEFPSGKDTSSRHCHHTLPSQWKLSKSKWRYLILPLHYWASLVAQTVKHLPAMRETRVRFLGREDPLEKEMAIHSSTLAWKIPWTEEPGRLQSVGSQRAGTRLSELTLTFCFCDISLCMSKDLEL